MRLCRRLALLVLIAITAFALPGQKTERAPVFDAARATATAEPQYPHNSIAQGTVTLELTIGVSGELERVNVLQPLPSLTEEAVRTVRKWSFRAATLDGKPVRSTMIVSFTFRTIIPPIK